MRATSVFAEEDGQFVYVSTKTGCLHIWKNEKSWYYVGKYDFKSRAINDVRLTNDDELLLVHCADDTLKSIQQAALVNECQGSASDDVMTQRLAHSLSDVSDAHLLVISGGQLITCSRRAYLMVWDLETDCVVNQVDLCSESSIEPEAVVVSQSEHAIFYDKDRAVLIQTPDQTIIKNVTFAPRSIISMTTDNRSLAYVLLANNKQLSVAILDMTSGSTVDEITIQDTVNSSNIRLMLTRNRKYLVLQVLCGDRELEIIRKANKLMATGKATTPSAGKYKILALKLGDESGEASRRP